MTVSGASGKGDESVDSVMVWTQVRDLSVTFYNSLKHNDCIIITSHAKALS